MKKTSNTQAFFLNKPGQRMNEEIHCINNKGKTAKNEWENNDSDFLVALYCAYKKLGQFFFHTLPTNLFKKRYISSVTSYKYLNKLISEK